MDDKDIRFTDKKIDESWKEQASRDKERLDRTAAPSSAPAAQPKAAPAKPSQPFINLLSSLGYQGMMHLGEIQDPMAPGREPDLQGAKEIIDLLMALRNKTAGNLAPEEKELFEQLLPGLQMKFSEKA